MKNYTPRDAVLIPLLQAIVSGVIALVLSMSVLYVTGIGNPLRHGLLIASLIMASFWFRRMGDLGPPTKDSKTKSEQQNLRVTVEEANENGKYEVAFLDFPGLTADLYDTFAYGVTIEQRPLSEASWVGAGNPFSRGQYNNLRDELILRGYACWVNPMAKAQGWQLTSKGRAMLRGRFYDMEGV